MTNKIKVSITLSSNLDATLRQLAKNQNTSYSSLVDEYLELALLVKEEKLANELLGPTLQTTIRKEVRAMAGRLSHLLSRAALESSNCKLLIFQLLVKEFGEERAFDFRDQAWQASVDDLKKPLESLEAILNPADDQEKTDMPV
jgi:hypothetical protein